MKRKQFEGKLEEKKAAEKREKWLQELEARDKEDREWRDRIEKPYREAEAAALAAQEAAKNAAGQAKEVLEKKFSSKSVDGKLPRRDWSSSSWTFRTAKAWGRF